jgi:hypothetical protein
VDSLRSGGAVYREGIAERRDEHRFLCEAGTSPRRSLTSSRCLSSYSYRLSSPERTPLHPHKLLRDDCAPENPEQQLQGGI